MIHIKEVDKSFLELYDRIPMNVYVLQTGDFTWHLMEKNQLVR